MHEMYDVQEIHEMHEVRMPPSTFSLAKSAKSAKCAKCIKSAQLFLLLDPSGGKSDAADPFLIVPMSISEISGRHVSRCLGGNREAKSIHVSGSACALGDVYSIPQTCVSDGRYVPYLSEFYACCEWCPNQRFALTF